MSLLHDEDSVIKITQETSTLTIVDEDLKLILNWGKFEGKDSLRYELFKRCHLDDVIEQITAEEDLDSLKESEISAKVKFHYEVKKSDGHRDSNDFSFKKIKVGGVDSRRLNFSKDKDIHYISFDIEDQTDKKDESDKGDKLTIDKVVTLLDDVHNGEKSISEINLNQIKIFLQTIKNHKRGHTEVIIGGGGGGQKESDA